MTCTHCQKSYSKSRFKKVWLSPIESALLCNDCRWARLKRIKNGEPRYVGKLPKHPLRGERTYAMKFGKK